MPDFWHGIPVIKVHDFKDLKLPLQRLFKEAADADRAEAEAGAGADPEAQGEGRGGGRASEVGVGDSVLARWKGGSFFAGKIVAVNEDKTLAVQFDDGEV